tara:strand:+ start:9873 stop:10001 length:129 start_codon:yes stop_codon:yes gene_type:complete
MEYTNLDLGIDYLPYWDEPTETTEDEPTTETSNELNIIELPF